MTVIGIDRRNQKGPDLGQGGKRSPTGARRPQLLQYILIVSNCDTPNNLYRIFVPQLLLVQSKKKAKLTCYPGLI